MLVVSESHHSYKKGGSGQLLNFRRKGVRVGVRTYLKRLKRGTEVASEPQSLILSPVNF
jgi:hypothetical protein